jgi:glyoxylase-like metal-dependent hydrolase (beta-lactamase superfamily II)
MSLNIQEFYDELTATYTYVVSDPKTNDAIVIDPVWDFDQPSGKLTLDSYKKVKSFVSARKLKLHYCLETHAHADHLSAAQFFKRDFPELKTGISENIRVVQEVFKKLFNLSQEVKTDGSQFDFLIKDGQVFQAGSIQIKAIFTPGHTPACCSFLVENKLFVGDSIFMPDTGTGRCDFPNGSAETLFDSITQKIYTLPDSTEIFIGHDYKNGGKREAKFLSSVGEQKSSNIHVKFDTDKSTYVKMRVDRDRTLSAPKLLLPSLQVNILAGNLPTPESNGVSYMKLPLSLVG